MVRTRSWRLTAEMRGGRWKRAPERVSRARGRAAGFSRPAWRRRTATYSLPGKKVSASHRLDRCVLASSLLRLDEPGGPVNADDEASGHLGIKGSAMACFFYPEDAPEPGNDLMGRRIGRLVEVDNARLDVGCNVALEGRAPRGDWGEVGRANQKLVVIFEEEGPLRRIELWRCSL